MIHWNASENQWCLGISAAAYPPNAPEAGVSNNLAIDNYVEVALENGSIDIRIEPPAGTESGTFAVEILGPAKRDLRVAIVFDRTLETLLVSDAQGLIPPTQQTAVSPDPANAPSSPLVRYELAGSSALLPSVVNQAGAPIPIRIVALPEGAVKTDRIVKVSTLDAAGNPVGGLTIRFSAGRQQPTPFR